MKVLEVGSSLKSLFESIRYLAAFIGLLSYIARLYVTLILIWHPA